MNRVKAWMVVAVVLALFGCGDSSGGPSQTKGDSDEANSVADAPTKAAHPGQEIYENYCFSCHLTGLNGAPKMGDTQAWAPRIAKGSDLLLQSTVEGMGTIMPARGMCFDCSDQDLAAVVDYMVVNSQ